MIDQLVGAMKCELCGGPLEIDETVTINDYSIIISANETNVFDKVEDIVTKYLVYKCLNCGQTFKYTYKDLEKNIRKKITEKVLMLIVKGQIDASSCLQDKFLIYCGKCNGLDGLGSCTESIFNKCEINRFPINEL